MVSKDEATITLAHEEARITAKQVVTGRVTIETKIETTREDVTVFLESDQVDVARVRLDKQISEIPSTRTEGNVTIIPVVAEIVVVEKRLVLVEEIHITRRTETKKVEVPVTLKRQSALIHRHGAGDAIASED